MDENLITVDDFRRFVDATGYVTVAEQPLDPAEYPDADPSLLAPGSIVFRPSPGPIYLNDNRGWWQYLPGASWKRPDGPESTLDGLDEHPVVHVANDDV